MTTNYFENETNPFIIDVADQENYNLADYIQIQQKLKQKQKELDPFFESLYPTYMRISLVEMKRRCSKGVSQTMIDLSNTEIPTIKLFKIGNGGDGKNCIVCCKPLLVDRYNDSELIVNSLEEVGFNGHYMILNGGFPNPTGTEMKYAAVPYCFKIFMMLEAKNRGFNNVLWIDSVCYAINNPEPIFDKIKQNDAIFRSFPANCFESDSYNNAVFPKTIEYINNLVNRDIRNDSLVNSIVFGLNFTSPRIIDFIAEYYKMVKIGLPFLSAFPEETVFASIFNKPEYRYVLNDTHNLYIHAAYASKERATQLGYYFIQRT